MGSGVYGSIPTTTIPLGAPHPPQDMGQENPGGIWTCDLQFTTGDFMPTEPPMTHTRAGYDNCALTLTLKNSLNEDWVWILLTK